MCSLLNANVTLTGTACFGQKRLIRLFGNKPSKWVWQETIFLPTVMLWVRYSLKTLGTLLEVILMKTLSTSDTKLEISNHWIFQQYTNPKNMVKSTQKWSTRREVDFIQCQHV
ncbi:hypothetical protein ATANTOWER_002253 [Ataeniobius toweri]|uniref:Uncharacterized protein n=1 Tax=Ataeniobius toweri TaxID=208326 RepID=A0ABU7CHH3_9TELE|nr:hypothetical protein [Ataeniobius toweri]